MNESSCAICEECETTHLVEGNLITDGVMYSGRVGSSDPEASRAGFAQQARQLSFAEVPRASRLTREAGRPRSLARRPQCGPRDRH